jgi:hypothetical protein
MRTVARSKVHLISELDLNVRLRLKTLQDHFRITNQQQVLELSSQYADVQQRRKNQDINAWLDKYSRISSLCQSEDMAEMKGTRPQWAFIQAVQAQGHTLHINTRGNLGTASLRLCAASHRGRGGGGGGGGGAAAAAVASEGEEEAVAPGAGRHRSPLPLARKAEAGGKGAVEDLLKQRREC